MDPIVLSAIISGLFAFAGTIIGIIGSSKITVYRIEQLEKKVDAMSGFSERVTKIETKIDHIEQELHR